MDIKRHYHLLNIIHKSLKVCETLSTRVYESKLTTVNFIIHQYYFKLWKKLEKKLKRKKNSGFFALQVQYISTHCGTISRAFHNFARNFHHFFFFICIFISFLRRFYYIFTVWKRSMRHRVMGYGFCNNIHRFDWHWFELFDTQMRIPSESLSHAPRSYVTLILWATKKYRKQIWMCTFCLCPFFFSNQNNVKILTPLWELHGDDVCQPDSC